MRYQLKQKVLTLKDDFYILDENGRQLYKVDAKRFNLGGEQLTFLDMSGNELAVIKQKLLSLVPTYEIHRHGQMQAKVEKSLLGIFRDKFKVDLPGPNDYTVQGNVWEREYKFIRGGQTVAVVSKKLASLRDSYIIDVGEGEDDILILASTVAIDMITHDD